MWTNLALSLICTIFLYGWVLIGQARLSWPTGDPRKDRTNAEVLLAQSPSFFREQALATLARASLVESEQAHKRGDWEGAAEPLISLVSGPRTGRPRTGAEPEAQRRLERMPRDIVESMRTHVLKGEDDGALRDGSAFESVRSLADAQEVREAGEWNVRARIATITKLVNQGRLDDAMNAVGEVATSETPEWGKDQAYDLLPRIADAAVTRMLKKKQFDDAIAYLDRADELAKDQPDIQARLQSLRDRVNTAIYGPNSTAWRRPEQLPKLVFVGDAPPESPDSACIRIENATDYRMRIVFAAAGETVRRQTYHIPARKTGKLVLAPGSYYEAASIPSEPGIRPFTGKLEVEKGTWRQGFEIRSQSEYVPVR